MSRVKKLAGCLSVSNVFRSILRCIIRTNEQTYRYRETLKAIVSKVVGFHTFKLSFVRATNVNISVRHQNFVRNGT